MSTPRLRRLLGISLPLAALALSPAGSPMPANAAASGVMNAKEAAYAAELARLTLQERRGRNLVPLGEHAALTRAAVLYAQFLARPGIALSHAGDGSTPSQRASAQGYRAGTFYAASAENIASGYPTAAQCFAGWMASPGHRSNIMTDMAVSTANRRHLAVGVCIANGKTIAVQMFGVQQFVTRPRSARTSTAVPGRPMAHRVTGTVPASAVRSLVVPAPAFARAREVQQGESFAPGRAGAATASGYTGFGEHPNTHLRGAASRGLCSSGGRTTPR